ncbi:MAG: hypothetical protein FD161_3008 [Limisphaerales bacterium]|nr:MAG: hypothetical protein FD161_3008 [Limisphaerales bacterium]KAG0508121.1 MAG: hypothetical protein E1N63_2715 [Limisphaerales bacterium]TXT53026.1 MAG: hypothetical protein FD140_134 [Limisphaerales bacterium]
MNPLQEQWAARGFKKDFLAECVLAAVAEARARHPQPYVDMHHAMGVLDEEVHELRMETYKRSPRAAALQEELLQIAAVCLRAIEDVTFKPKCSRK